MGLFNWFRWQLERRAMLKEMDRLRADLSETERQLYYAKRDKVTLRSELAEAEQLLHEAQSGAKFAAEQQDKLRIQLDLLKSASAYWESVARDRQKRIAELRRPASELTSVTESTEPAESELERRAWEIFVHSTHGFSGCFTQAFHWMIERDRRRKEQENQTDGK